MNITNKHPYLFILALLLTLLPALSFAQKPPGNSFVAFDPPGRSRLYYGIGDEIFLKLDDEKEFSSWVITSVTDSGFVVEGRHFVDPARVKAIKVYPKRAVRGLKRILLFGGVGLPVLMVANFFISKDQQFVFIPTVAGISGGMLVTWLILKSFDWAGIRYKVSPERPLKMLIMDMKAP